MAITEMTLGEALDQARRKVGLTQDRLGELFRGAAGEDGVHNRTLIAWLRGDTEPKVGQYNILALIINEHFERLELKDRLPFLQVLGDDDAPGDPGAPVMTFRLPDGSEFQMSYYGHVPFVSNVVALPPSHDLADFVEDIGPPAVAA